MEKNLSRYIMVLWLLILWIPSKAQTFPIPGGPVASADTSCFPFFINLNSTIYPPGYMPFSLYISNICVNVTTPHPETLVIWLTSPAGTSLTLSAFNGAGGPNYTNTCFTLGGGSIAGVPGPMTGNYSPQDPLGFSVFDWENAFGTWHLCIADTLTDTTYTGPGGPWGPTAMASGTFGFGTSAGPPQPPPIPQGQSATICQGETFDLYTVFNDPNWFYDFYHNGNQVLNPNAITSPGVYDVYAIDWYWYHSDFAQFTLIVDSGPNLGPDIIANICGSAGVVDLNNYFPLAGTSYNWTSNGNPISNTNISVSGTYQVIAQNNFGCYDTAEITVNFLSSLYIGPDITVTGCDGFPFDLNQLLPTNLPPVPIFFTWYQGSSPLLGQPLVNSNGVYSLVGTDLNGCEDTLIATINFSPLISLGPDQYIDTCSGNVVDLNALFSLAGLSYTWSQGGVTIPASTASSISTSGTYQVIAQNNGGCADTAMITLNIFQGPALGPDTVITDCKNFPYNLNPLYNTAGLASAIWYFGSTPIPNPSVVFSNGAYTLIATDANGCVDTATVILNLSPFQSLGPDQTKDICYGENTDLTTLFNTFGHTPLWQFNGSVIPLPTQVSQTGVYTLIISNGGICADTANVTLNVLAAPLLGPDISSFRCSNVTFDLTTLYSTSGLTSTWFLNGSVVPYPSMVSAAGNYMLVAVNSSGCADTAFVFLSDSLPPDLGPDLTVAICNGDSIDLTSLFSTSGLDLLWELNGTQVSQPNAVTVPGNYLVTATNSSGCTDTATVNISQSAGPVIGPDKQIIVCEGTPVDLTSLYNVSAYVNTWTSNNVVINNPIQIMQTGLFVLTCVNNAGCSDSAFVTIIHKQVPDLGSDGTDTICDGSFVDLNSYFPVNTLSTNWTLNNVPVSSSAGTNGNYQLVAGNIFGCYDTALFNLVVNESPDLGPDRDIDLCPWMNVDLSTLVPPTGNIIYWFFNGQLISATAQIHEAGAYQAIAFNDNGCSDTLLVNITNIHCECVADFIYEGSCMEDPVKFTTVADSIVLSSYWNFSQPSMNDLFIQDPSVFFVTDQPVVVTLVTQLSCGTVTTTKTIRVDDCSELCPIYIPNAFTPNSDGKNDNFMAITECNPQDFEMQIMNRFGQMIFNAKDPNQMWDGTFGGSVSAEGIYIYTIRYKMPYQVEKAISGHLTLIR